MCLEVRLFQKKPHKTTMAGRGTGRYSAGLHNQLVTQLGGIYDQGLSERAARFFIHSLSSSLNGRSRSDVVINCVFLCLRSVPATAISWEGVGWRVKFASQLRIKLLPVQ